MVSVNSVVLGGHVGAAPEQKVSSLGKPICTFRLATNRWDARAEQKVADWHNVVVFEKQAETCLRYLKKGSPVLVEGRVQVRQWDADDGKRQTRTEIVAFRVNFLNAGSPEGERRFDASGERGGPPPDEATVPF